MQTKEGLAYLTAEEMAEFDRAAIEDFRIDEPLLMENAGAAVARVARMMLDGRVDGRKISCLVGKGNNGGDGLVAARHLHNWGANVNLALGGEPSELKDLPAKQLSILEKMGVGSSGPETRVSDSDLVIDALFGYNLKGNPREPAAEMIRRANSSKVRILAVDIPSGLDASTGAPGDPCVVAAVTVTLGLPKAGFLGPEARRYLGGLYVADISFPTSLYRKYSQDRRLFSEDSLFRVW